MAKKKADNPEPEPTDAPTPGEPGNTDPTDPGTPPNPDEQAPSGAEPEPDTVGDAPPPTAEPGAFTF